MVPKKHSLQILTPGSVNVPRPPNNKRLLSIWRDENGREIAFGFTLSAVNYLVIPGIGSFSFKEKGVPTAIPEFGTELKAIEDIYWRTALPLILQMQGLGALHASAILTPTGIIGFCAEANTGKSTLAYGLSLRGFPLWTDDALVFTAQVNSVMAHSLPFKSRLRPDPAKLFQTSALGKKDPAYLQRKFQQAEIDKAPVRAIISLVRSPEESTEISLLRMKGAAAVSEIMRQGYAFSLIDIEQRHAFSQQYLNLAAQVPVYSLHFPSGLHHVASILDKLEDHLNLTSKGNPHGPGSDI